MADKLLKSIKFPTLPDRYVIGDTTLTEEGAAADAKAVGDALATKADTKGRYEDLIVGGAEQLMADEYETDKEPYLFRPTGGSADVGNREYLDSIVGGTVAWNQLVSASATSVTVQSGHKYIAKIGGAWSVAASSGSTISVTGGTDMLIDLTALFNPTIADYIYSLEQSQAGAGVAWFRQYFPKDYYPYDPGTLRSVEGVSAHVTTGFNQWDEEWESGWISSTTGNKAIDATAIRSKNHIPVLPNTTYYAKTDGYNGANRIAYYDESKQFLDSSVGGRWAVLPNGMFTTPKEAHYMMFCIANTTTYKNDICINLSDPTRNGEYEPYVKHTYPLDSSLTLRGIPKLVDGKLAYDGDTYKSDGTVTRKRKQLLIDGNTESISGAWGATSVGYAVYKTVSDMETQVFARNMLISDKFFVSENSYKNMPLYTFGGESGAYTTVTFILPSTVTSVAEANAWFASNPTTIEYPVATPTTETADGYEHYQICDPSGTEEFVTDSIVPVGHETRYPHDLKKKVETAPDSPSTDGTYLMKRSGGKNTYMALPSTPSANGSYVLTLTVSGGSASYSWTAKE